ncbi:hypothetical protein JTB14_026892 [Gonioctena quinquepunctata]|nr:hypothetical protein JTB14_026892 [Gonioctena quinquepunctata]
MYNVHPDKQKLIHLNWIPPVKTYSHGAKRNPLPRPLQQDFSFAAEVGVATTVSRPAAILVVSGETNAAHVDVSLSRSLRAMFSTTGRRTLFWQ